MNDIIKKDDLRVSIQSKIYVIRGQRVMLDFDLAAMYGVKTGRLNEQVKRNIRLHVPINKRRIGNFKITICDIKKDRLSRR